MINHPNRGKRPAVVSGVTPFVVTTDATGPTYFLRKTTWTGQRDRASVFESVEAAQEAIDRSRQFNPKAARVAKIVGEG